MDYIQFLFKIFTKILFYYLTLKNSVCVVMSDTLGVITDSCNLNVDLMSEVGNSMVNSPLSLVWERGSHKSVFRKSSKLNDRSS